MKVRFLVGVVVAAIVVGSIGLLTTSAGAASWMSLSHERGMTSQPNSVAALIYSQYDNDTGAAIVSQNFEAFFDNYDSALADDFTLDSKHVIRRILVAGQYWAGSGPARDETVTIYKDAAGLPGEVKVSITRQGADTNGSFVIKTPGIHVGIGTYWLSVVANMDFETGGEWGWETRSIQSGNPAVFENPGDGFGTGCVTWGVMQTCITDAGEGPDLMFALKGRPSA